MNKFTHALNRPTIPAFILYLVFNKTGPQMWPEVNVSIVRGKDFCNLPYNQRSKHMGIVAKLVQYLPAVQQTGVEYFVCLHFAKLVWT